MSRPIGLYPGESDPKRLARLAIYNRTLSLQPASVRKEGFNIVLCGEDAGELGCLRYLLKTPPDLTWFVDNHQTRGLNKVAREWPEAEYALRDVKEVVEGVNSIAFLHLDFMGLLNDEREDIIKLAAPKMKMWGIMFYVFFRGHEKPSVDFWKHYNGARAKTPEGKRFVGAAGAIQKALGPHFKPVFSLRYTGVTRREARNTRQGAMGILGFQKIPVDYTSNNYWMGMLMQPSPFGGNVPTDEKLLQEHLRIEALELRRRGHNSKEVSAILNIGVGKVAAWFANSSRGTYNA